MKEKWFDLGCRDCPRLAEFLNELSLKYPDYHARPVPPFGVDDAQLLIVGLAPGMHGANATGRPFTGDHAGILLYQTLYKMGFCNQAEASGIDDGLTLINCRISNAVKCLPPANKPTTSEIRQCNHFIAAEIKDLEKGAVVVALGRIAHNAILIALGYKQSAYPFGHAVEHRFDSGLLMIDSYHCSRYNTQTKRLTEPMFLAVFNAAKKAIQNNK